LLRRNLCSGPANPIATPQSFSAGRQIPLLLRNHFSGPANPIATPPALICFIKYILKSRIIIELRQH
jgi:hypothetical protein